MSGYRKYRNTRWKERETLRVRLTEFDAEQKEALIESELSALDEGIWSTDNPNEAAFMAAELNKMFRRESKSEDWEQKGWLNVAEGDQSAEFPPNEEAFSAFQNG